MLFLIVGAIIGAVVGVKELWDRWDTLFSVLVTGLCSLVGVLIGILLAIFYTFLYSAVNPNLKLDDYAMSESMPVIAATDSSGNVRSIYAYRSQENILYIQETEFGYKESSVASSKTFIRYTDDVTEPHIEKWVLDTLSSKLFDLPGCSDDTAVYILYVPEGSISVDGTYEFDLQ